MTFNYSQVITEGKETLHFSIGMGPVTIFTLKCHGLLAHLVDVII